MSGEEGPAGEGDGGLGGTEEAASVEEQEMIGRGNLLTHRLSCVPH